MSAKDQYIRTDLAVELPPTDERKPVKGYTVSEEKKKNTVITRIEITDPTGEQLLGKPMGHYITLSFARPWLLDAAQRKEIASVLSEECTALIGKPSLQDNVLIVGLGNREITADAVGPLTVERIQVTRHLRTFEAALFERIATCAVSAIAPGVVGQTGIETAELIRGTVERTRPSLVVAIDALAARSVDRLAVTVQISDTGISPGAGIGNRRLPINADTIGIPVIAIGVPTVVDSSTLVYDALHEAGIDEVSPALKRVLENGRSFFVSLKETDAAVDALSHILAYALNTAFGCLIDDIIS